jgi:hypothetical protein
MFHTAYNSFESKPKGRDYIGKHSTEDLNDGYLGSFTDKEFDPDSKITMAYSKTAEGAVWFEINFQNVFGVVQDPQYVNRAKQTSTGYDRTGVTQTDETKQKQREARTGKTSTEETKRLMSEAHTGDKNHMFGKNHTEETKQLMSDLKIGKKWYVNEKGEIRMSKDPPGPEWQWGRKWKK